MIPKIFHRTVPEKVDPRQEAFWESFKNHNPDYEFQTWRDPVDPSEFELAHLWPSCNNGAQLADLIRLEVVYKFGGIYVDADMECVAPFPTFEHTDFFIGTEDGERATNALFGASPGNNELEKIINYLKGFDALPSNVPANIATGPELFSRHLRFSENVLVLPREVFYPIPYTGKPHKETEVQSLNKTLTIHHWDGSWLTHKPTASTKRRERKRLRKLKRKESRQKIYSALASLYLKVRKLLPVTHGYTNSDYLVVKTRYDCYLMADPKDISVTPQLYFGGTYEKHETEVAKLIVRKGDWIIDVGANIGYFSILFAKLTGPFGRVFCFEPNTNLRVLLTKSTMMNYFQDRLSISDSAVSNKNGLADFEISDTIAGGSSLLPNAFESATIGMEKNAISRRSENVKTERLDTLFDKNIPIRLLKIDVEGAEPYVFEGAASLLKEYTIDVIMFETLNESVGTERLLMRDILKHAIESLDYALATLRKGKLTLCTMTDWEYGSGRSYYLISPKAKDIPLEHC